MSKTPAAPIKPELYSYTDTAKILGGIGRSSVYNLIDDGYLTRVHVGRRAFITAASIDAYVALLTKVAAKNGKEA